MRTFLAIVAWFFGILLVACVAGAIHMQGFINECHENGGTITENTVWVTHCHY